MNILFVAAGSFPGNASLIRAAAFGGHLKKLGHHVSYCLTSSPGTLDLLEIHGVEDCCRWISDRNPLNFLRVTHHYRGYDIIHLIDVSLAGELMAVVLRMSGVKVISDWDEWLSRWPVGAFRRFQWLLMEFVARHISSAFVFSSSFLKTTYEQFLSDTPTAYIPWGFNPDTSPSGGISAKVLALNSKYALYLGSLGVAYREDLNELILLAKCCRVLNLNLIIAGDGSERGRLERSLKDVLNDERLIFTGQLDLPDLDGLVGLAQIKACFLPLRDTMQNKCRCPNKLQHYIKAGKPVVTNRVGEPASLLGEQGFYYIYGDEQSLCMALEKAAGAKLFYNLDEFCWNKRISDYITFINMHFHFSNRTRGR